MRKFDVQTTPAAEQDIDEIVDYLLLEDPNAALSFLDELEHVKRQLADFPESGALMRTKRFARKGYRFLTALGYLVFYVFREETVVVMRIIHARRNSRAIL